MNRWITTNRLLEKNPDHLTLISFIHSYFKGLWFYGVCDSFCLFAYLTYLVCWHVKCLKFSVSTCIYLFSWRQILNHFSFQKTGWGFSIYNIVSLIKSLLNWWFISNKKPMMKKCFLFMNVNQLVNVLEVSGTNVAIKSCIVPWMILNICIWNKSYNRLISVMTVVVINWSWSVAK